ncbi:NrfD/PsrC family molybdoenzyme membrane anchor subunit [Rhodoblastus sp.]|uniref:NrfD/PsrC family molybdoenzyme membrane anchor subunit n=1 Tax=Rhodoblastus sp. TaxID=1962975 RepID=UPI003F9CDDC6
MAQIKFRRLTSHSPTFWALVLAHVAAVAVGLSAALYMEMNGHHVTGMTNQIVWGTPHVFAVFLIVSASGALNVASVSSVFHRLAYKPFARLSGVLAVALLAGGLAVLVLDLGRPDRLLVAMTTYNFRSIFAWNIYLYTGFMVIVLAYLFSMMDRRVSKITTVTMSLGLTAFAWRLILTTGTGSIFGFLVARDAVSGGVMAPLFIASSLVYGLAFTVLVLLMMSIEAHETLCTREMISKFRGLLIIFSLTVLFLTAILHVSKIYAAPTRAVEAFILRDGGIYPLVFWGVQIFLGNILPLLMLAYMPRAYSKRNTLGLAAILFLIGGLAQMYVVIIGTQAFPLSIFPGYEVSSTFGDGVIAAYAPSLPEILLGLSGISIAMLIATAAFYLLPFLPQGVPLDPHGVPLDPEEAVADAGAAA